MNAEAKAEKFFAELSEALGFDVKSLDSVITCDRSKAITVSEQMGQLSIEIHDLDPNKLTSVFAQKSGHRLSGQLKSSFDKDYIRLDLSHLSYKDETPYRIQKTQWQDSGYGRSTSQASPESEELESAEDLAQALSEKLDENGFGSALQNLRSDGKAFTVTDENTPIADYVRASLPAAIRPDMNVLSKDRVIIPVEELEGRETDGWSLADNIRQMIQKKNSQIRIERDAEGLIGIFVEEVSVTKEHARQDYKTHQILDTHVSGEWDSAAEKFLADQLSSTRPLTPSPGFTVPEKARL